MLTNAVRQEHSDPLSHHDRAPFALRVVQQIVGTPRRIEPRRVVGNDAPMKLHNVITAGGCYRAAFSCDGVIEERRIAYRTGRQPVGRVAAVRQRYRPALSYGLLWRKREKHALGEGVGAREAVAEALIEPLAGTRGISSDGHIFLRESCGGPTTG